MTIDRLRETAPVFLSDAACPTQARFLFPPALSLPGRYPATSQTRKRSRSSDDTCSCGGISWRSCDSSVSEYWKCVCDPMPPVRGAAASCWICCVVNQDCIGAFCVVLQLSEVGNDGRMAGCSPGARSRHRSRVGPVLARQAGWIAAPRTRTIPWKTGRQGRTLRFKERRAESGEQRRCRDACHQMFAVHNVFLEKGNKDPLCTL